MYIFIYNSFVSFLAIGILSFSGCELLRVEKWKAVFCFFPQKNCQWFYIHCSEWYSTVLNFELFRCIFVRLFINISRVDQFFFFSCKKELTDIRWNIFGVVSYLGPQFLCFLGTLCSLYKLLIRLQVSLTEENFYMQALRVHTGN